MKDEGRERNRWDEQANDGHRYIKINGKRERLTGKEERVRLESGN